MTANAKASWFSRTAASSPAPSSARRARRWARPSSPPACRATRRPSPIPATTVRSWWPRHRRSATPAGTSRTARAAATRSGWPATPCAIPSPRASNWRATGTLEDELVRQGIVGIAGIDTRAVVRHLRSRGSMKAGVFSGAALRRRRRTVGPGARPGRDARRGPGGRGQHRRQLCRRTRRVATVHRRRSGPGHQDEHPAQLRQARYPQSCAALVGELRARSPSCAPTGCSCPTGRAIRPPPITSSTLTREVLDAGIPLFGICFGNQILGRALGPLHLQDDLRPSWHQHPRHGPCHPSGGDHRAEPRLRPGG